MERCDLAIIGSGMAATRLVETLRRRGDRRSITLLGAERTLPYNRIMLSPLLAGETDWQQLISHPAEWYAQQRVDLRLGVAVSALDTQARRLRCADGFELAFDELVIATGSRSAKPALPGIDLPGVTGFRDFDDVTALQHAASRGGAAVVLGGGLLGLEAAVALAVRGLAVTLVHRAERLMNRQLDAVAAGYLQRAIEARGVRVCTGRAPLAVLGETAAEAVLLEGGERIEAQLVVAATGIRPATTLAAAAGLAVNSGVVVDGCLRTSAPGVYALGECNELNGETVGLVAPIWQQVDVLAANLCGEARTFEALPYVTKLKVSGIDVHVMGELEPQPGDRVLAYQDREFGIYKKLQLRDGRLRGALLFGDVADSGCFFNLLQCGTAIDGDGCRLLLAGELPAAAGLAIA